MSANTPLIDQDWTPWPIDLVRYYRQQGHWQGEPLDQLLQQSARRHPDRTALVCGARRWTYAELNTRSDQFAQGLRRLGLNAGDRVVVQLPNIAEFFVTCFALWRIGAWPVMALPAHRHAEIGYFCAHTHAKAYVVVDHEQGFDYRPMAQQLQQTHPTLKHVIVVGDAQAFTDFDDVRQPTQPLQPMPRVDASEVALLQLSGGSTGQPKLIPRTHDDYAYSVRASAKICELDRHTVYLCVLPVAHNFPLSSPGTLGVFHAGGTVVLTRQAHPDHTFPLIEQEGVTMTALVPPLVPIWLDAARHSRFSLDSLQWLQVGGAKLAAEVAQRIKPELGCRLQQVFGMAEGLVNYTRFDDPDERVMHTQGRPISPDDEVRIVDDQDMDVEAGQVGHLLTRGPYTIRGYYRAATHNARAFTPSGYYRTGDLARLLPSGHLIVEGRAKDQINRGGEKIAAEEVENHLLAHPAVHDVALVAMPDPYLGEKTCAFVIPRGDTLTRRDLTGFLRQRGLATYKIPDRYEFVPSLPQTSVGKVNKRALREQLVQS